LGDQLYANLKAQGRKSSFPQESDPNSTSLQDRILDSLNETYTSSKGFVSWAKVESLINEESVAQELASDDASTGTISSTIRDISRRVCRPIGPHYEYHMHRRPRSFRNIFAILVMIGKPSTIRGFLEAGVNDADLPLVKHEHGQKRNFFELRRKGDKTQPLECFRGWKRLDIKNFEEWQWITLAPFFARGERKDVKHYQLPGQAPLPFTFDSRKHSEEVLGGFSRVFKTDIHPDHHDFHDPSVRCFHQCGQLSLLQS
jgi:hypothetical protein